MEAAGLVVGIAGLAGLFTTCIDMLSRAQKYRTFKNDSRALSVRLSGARVRFEHWGSETSIQLHHDSLFDEKDLDSHPALKNPQIVEAVTEHLDIIQELFAPGKAKSGPDASGPVSSSSQSKRRRLAWALGGKEIREEHVAGLETLVQNLHDLVPLDSQSYTGRTVNVDLPGIEEVRGMLSEIAKEVTLNQRREVFKWLSNPSSNQDLFQDSLKTQLEGTCEWILNRPAFVRWNASPTTDTSPRILWIHGPGGFGKTILCASLAKTLALNGAVKVATYFFSSNFESRENPSLAVRSWIAQLIEQDQSAFDIACEQMQEDDNITASRTAIYELFSAILRKTSPCILVLDGVDECESFADGEPNSALAFLRNVVGAIPESKSRFLVVSRGLLAIREALESTQSGFVEHAVTMSDVETDNAAVSTDVVNRRLKKRTPEDRALISGILIDRCQGQFLWVRLQERRLRGATPMAILRKGLENTPVDLDKIYDREWSRILSLDEDLRDWAISLLRWTACASRPLTVAETTGAIMVDKPIEELEAYSNQLDEDYINEMIKDICGSLLNVHCGGDGTKVADMTLRIPHFTIREFLLDRLPFTTLELENPLLLSMKNDERQHALLADSCLRYLNGPLIWGTSSSTSALTWLRSYASFFWHTHAKRGWRKDMTDAVVELVVGVGTRGWRRQIEQLEASLEGVQTSEWAPLAHAVRLNLVDVVLSLIQRKGCCVNEPTYEQKWTTPLIYACSLGHMSLVEVLLDNGADISQMSLFAGSRAMHWAAARGRNAILRCLLSRSAAVKIEVDAENKFGSTPLLVASETGHVEVVQSLIDAGANISHADYKGATALYRAANNGNIDLVSLLLHNCAAHDVETHEGWQPLAPACESGNLAVVELLLDHGADPCHAGGSKEGRTTMLALAVREGHLQIVQCLLTKGAIVCTYDGIVRSPLHHAASAGYIDIVRLLLKEDPASVSVKDLYGHTPLWFAARHGHHTVVEILLQYNEVDVETEDECQWSPLLLAAGNGHIEVVKILMTNARICCDHADIWNRTPLLWAAFLGQDVCVQFMLEDGRCDPTYRDSRGHTALRLAAIRGHVSVARMLLGDERVDPNTVCHNRLTPLAAAAFYGQDEIVLMMLACPRVKVCHRDSKNGKSLALNLAAAEGHGSTVRHLLKDSRSDINALDGFGQSSLMAAANNGHVDMIELLLAEDGIDTTCADSMGLTALCLAAKEGHSNAVQSLLKSSKVDPACTDPYGKTALALAAVGGHLRTVQSLLADGRFDANNQDRWKQTLFMSAAFEGQGEVVEELLALPQLEVTSQGPDGLTALHFAAAGDHEGIVSHLLNDVRIDPNAGDTWQSSTLMQAACDGQQSVVELLLAHPRVLPDQPNVWGQTALSLASRFGHKSIVQTLLADGRSDPANRDWCHLTPLFTAVANGHSEIVDLLLEQTDPVEDRGGFGRDLFWWAHRSGNREVVRLLGSSTAALGSEDFPGVVQFDANRAWCDACTLTMKDSDDKYYCEEEGTHGMCLCSECYNRGIRCVDPSHERLSRDRRLSMSS